MDNLVETKRHLIGDMPEYLKCPKARLQPILAKEGKAVMDLDSLAGILKPVAELEPLITVKSPEHWAQAVAGLDENIDAILPLSIPAYPTEVWNSHPQPLIQKNIPLIFWPLLDYDEPDFWRWSASDFLRALGIEVFLPKNISHGLTIVKSLAIKRFLNGSKMVVFGEQNFPWNANAAGRLIKDSLGIDIIVHPIEEIRKRYDLHVGKKLQEIWDQRKDRYSIKNVKQDQLTQAVKTYLAIKSILEEEKAIAFGLNCFGDLVTGGGRDVPCLAQAFLREDGYITSCDGDFLAMISMLLITMLLDKPCMMSNMYPVKYVGALTDHFGDPLSPDEDRFPKEQWNNLARLAHCGFVGIVSPEMTPAGKTVLCDWGGTYEIKRDGSGCGLDGDLAGNMPVTVVEMKFDGRTLLLADAEIIETTRHQGMPHCESSVLMNFRDLESFVENISREHTAVVYGRHIDELKTLGQILNLTCKEF